MQVLKSIINTPDAMVTNIHHFNELNYQLVTFSVLVAPGVVFKSPHITQISLNFTLIKHSIMAGEVAADNLK